MLLSYDNDLNNNVYLLYWVSHLFYSTYSLFHIRQIVINVNTVDYYVFLFVCIYKMPKKANKSCFLKLVAKSDFMWYQNKCMLEVNLCKGWWQGAFIIILEGHVSLSWTSSLAVDQQHWPSVHAPWNENRWSSHLHQCSVRSSHRSLQNQ